MLNSHETLMKIVQKRYQVTLTHTLFGGNKTKKRNTVETHQKKKRKKLHLFSNVKKLIVFNLWVGYVFEEMYSLVFFPVSGVCQGVVSRLF